MSEEGRTHHPLLPDEQIEALDQGLKALMARHERGVDTSLSWREAKRRIRTRAGRINRSRMNRDNLYFVQFEATSRSDHVDAATIAGAFVNCWICTPDAESAIERAQEMIRAERWVVSEPDEVQLVNSETIESSGDVRPYIEQALLDGEVYVFHSFPTEEANDEVE